MGTSAAGSGDSEAVFRLVLVSLVLLDSAAAGGGAAAAGKGIRRPGTGERRAETEREEKELTCRVDGEREIREFDAPDREEIAPKSAGEIWDGERGRAGRRRRGVRVRKFKSVLGMREGGLVWPREDNKLYLTWEYNCVLDYLFNNKRSPGHVLESVRI